MPFPWAQEPIQRAGYDRPHGQAAAAGVFPQPFYRARGKLQGDRHGGFGNFHGAIELGGLVQVAIGLALGQIELAG